jgi:50S ribosomal protein L16 3-hydroxylase
MESAFLGNLTPLDFLKNYWNKKPLLIRNAVKNAGEMASLSEFIDMAQDEYFETRMVYESGGEYPWQAKAGPFKESDFIPDALWTLICHNLELLNSDFFALKKNIRFIPDWNFDDLMATVSKKGASVGAHIDDYSVFIIQGAGKRKWLLQENAVPDYIPNLDIKLLQVFNPTIEWILEPGDMIYIPPNVAHHGISLEDSISYSLGFKSIRYKELLDYHITQVLVQVDEASYHDPDLQLQDDPFLLQENVLENIYQELVTFMNDKLAFKNSLLMYLSRPKNIIEKTGQSTAKEILQELKTRAHFKRDVWAKLVAVNRADDEIQVAINNHLFWISKKSYQRLKEMFLLEADESVSLSKSDLGNTELTQLMANLIEEGVFYFI